MELAELSVPALLEVLLRSGQPEAPARPSIVKKKRKRIQEPPVLIHYRAQVVAHFHSLDILSPLFTDVAIVFVFIGGQRRRAVYCSHTD